MSQRPVSVVAATLLCVACALAACGGGDTPTTTPPTLEPVSTVTVSLSATTLAAGQAGAAAAELRSAAGAVLTGRTVSWTSSDNAIATVSASGTIAAVAPGSATITATSEGRSGSAQLTVTPAPVASITISVDSARVPVRQTLQLTATVRDAAGGVLTGRPVTWSVSNTASGSISATGLFRMLDLGNVQVTASSEGRSATAIMRSSVVSLDALLDSIRLARGLPALGGAIVTTEGIVAIGVAGVRRAGAATAVTVNDKWHLGSETKAMTSVLAAIGVQQGTLSWTRTLQQAFPDLLATMRTEYRDVTLTELLSHTGGVVNTTAGLTANADLSVSRTAWTNYAVQQPPQNARGVFYYSNTGYGMAGAMIERAMGGTYESLMQTRIFGPLAMQNVGWGATTTAGANDQPQGHRFQNGALVVCEGCDNQAGLSSAGTAHMPLASWARLIQELLLADRGRSALLTQASARTLMSNQVPLASGVQYGFGWNVGGTATNRAVFHDGTNTYNLARAVLFLDANAAFLLTTNVGEPTPGAVDAAISSARLRLDSYWINGR